MMKISVSFHRVVAHENANKLDHCTISLKGVTRMRSDDETEFVPLDRWEQEYKFFQKLVKVFSSVHAVKYAALFVNCNIMKV